MDPVVFFPDETREMLLGVSKVGFAPVTNAKRFEIAEDLRRRIMRRLPNN